MNKFFVLLKKEVKEMLTIETLAPMLVTVLLFVFIGKVVGTETKKSSTNNKLLVINEDSGEYGQLALNILTSGGVQYTLGAKFSEDEIKADVKEGDYRGALIIPAEFSSSIIAGTPAKMQVYILMNNLSLTGIETAQFLTGVTQLIQEGISNVILTKEITGVDPNFLKYPVARVDRVIIADKEAIISADAVISFVQSQTMFIPTVLFMVIVFASTMIATAVANEKENKTLETLLTLPIDRNIIVSAKMIGAGIVALLFAGIYMAGFGYYMKGLTQIGGEAAVTAEVTKAVSDLGLNFDIEAYVLIGITLFFSILCALAIAMIIGSFAKDSKSVQGLISPLMIMLMVPYFLTMFMDPTTLSPALKILLYANPLSYPFLVAPNVMLDNKELIFFGMAYQFVVFLIFVRIASRIFSADHIVVFNFDLKKLSRKGKSAQSSNGES